MQEPEVWLLLERLSVIAKQHGTRSTVVWHLLTASRCRHFASRHSFMPPDGDPNDAHFRQHCMCHCRLLCEVHEDFQLNVTLAAHGYWVRMLQ